MVVRRSRASCLWPSVPRSWPAKTTLPAVIVSMPLRLYSSVDLPDPDGPMTATISPSWTSRSTACSTSWSPKAFVSPRARRMVVDAVMTTPYSVVRLETVAVVMLRELAVVARVTKPTSAAGRTR
jgi:hypothetical protein